MLTRIEQRMIKEGLIAAAPFAKNIANHALYYIDDSDDEVACRTMSRRCHQMPFIPWPASNCVLFSHPNMIGNLIGSELGTQSDPIRSSAKCLNITIKSQKNDGFLNGQKVMFQRSSTSMIVQNSFAVTHMTVTYINNCIKTRLISPVYGICYCQFASDSDASKMLNVLIEHQYQSPPEWMRASHGERADLAQRRICNAVEGIRPSKGMLWLAYQVENDGRTGFMPEICIIPTLGALYTPCGYVAASFFKEGFGPPSLKKKTAGKKIFCRVGYDRLWRAANAEGDRTVTGHGRRQHSRHLWKEAGLDRFQLPASPVERERLAEEHNVRTILIRETWVGPRSFTFEGMDWDIEEAPDA